MTAEDPHSHRVLLYRSIPEMRIAVVPFLRDGLTLGESVILSVRPEEEPPILQTLGDAVGAITVDSVGAYAMPEDAAEAMRAMIAAALEAGAPAVRIAGSLPEGFEHRWEEWSRYETEIDEVLRGLPATAMCIYDATAVSPDTAEHILRLHPALAEPFGMSAANEAYSPG